MSHAALSDRRIIAGGAAGVFEYRRIEVSPFTRSGIGGVRDANGGINAFDHHVPRSASIQLLIADARAGIGHVDVIRDTPAAKPVPVAPPAALPTHRLPYARWPNR